MLPPATVSGHISLINAFFTATSAVCVTGLIVVDTGSYFTLFGQGVILFLIQIGGLGFPVVYEIFSRFFMGQSGKLSIQTKSVVLTTLGLTLAGKLVIIALMIIGRVGVPAITYIIVGGAPKKGLQFAEENLMIG
jgi:Trk-type K+ transport system membrane component